MFVVRHRSGARNVQNGAAVTPRSGPHPVCRSAWFLVVGLIAGAVCLGPLVPAALAQPFGVLQKTVPFTDAQTVKPNDNFTYQFAVQAGQCTFTAKPQFDAILDIKIYQNGALVAQDNGLKNNFALSWNAVAAGNVQVQIKSTDNLTNNITFSAQQGGGGVINPPVVGGGQVLNVNGNTQGVGQQVHNVQLQPGVTYTINCKTLQNPYDPYIWLYSPNGQQLAADDDGGGFPNAKITYTAPAAGNYQIKVGGFGNSQGPYNLTVTSAAAPPPVQPVANTYQKAGSFGDVQNVKPGDSYTYNVTLNQGGQCSLNVKPQIDAILNIQVFQNGVLVAQDVNGGVKQNFQLNFNCQAGALQIQIKSTDNLANNCNVNFTAPGGIAPPPPPPPVGGAFNKAGTFTDFQVVKPNDSYTYNVTLNQGGQAGLNIKPQIDAILDIKVYQNGVLLAQDNGLKTNFQLNFNCQAGAVQIQVKSTDTLTNNCNINFTAPGGIAPPPLPPVGAGFNKVGTFADFQMIKPNDSYTYNVTLNQGGQCSLNVKPQIDAILNIQVYQNGVLLAQDTNGGVKTNFQLNFNCQAGSLKIQLNSPDTLTNNCNINFTAPAGGALPVQPVGVMNKNVNLPFTDFQVIKPNDNLTYQFPVQAGAHTFTIKPQVDAILDIKVYQNGVVVAQDTGLKTNFVLSWNAQFAGNVQVQIKSTDTLTNNCTISGQ